MFVFLVTEHFFRRWYDHILDHHTQSPDPTEIIMAWDHQVTAITDPEERIMAFMESRLLFTGKSPEVEVVLQWGEEAHLKAITGNHDSTIGGLQMKILITPIHPKLSHLIRGDLRLRGQTGPHMANIIRAVLDTEVHLSTVTLLVTGHHHQGIFTATRMIGGPALHHPSGAHSEEHSEEKGTQVILIQSQGVETHLRTTVQEKDPMSPHMGSDGMGQERFLIRTMRRVPESFMAEVQRGTEVMLGLQLGKSIKLAPSHDF